MNDIRKEFDEMFEKMQTPEAKAAYTKAFSASPEELGAAAVIGARKAKEEQMKLKLVEPPEITKVLDLSSVETYHTKGVVVHRLEAPLRVLNPVPVYGRGVRIGFASCYIQDNRLLADFFLARDCPERLDLENGRNLYPRALFSGFKDSNSIESIYLDDCQYAFATALGGPLA